MWIINSIVGAIVSAALWPFRELPPMVGLTIFSLVTGVATLYVFKWTSDQKGLDEVKRKIHAGIFEIRLFNDDMRLILAAQRDIFRYNLRYLRLSLTPLLVMIVPFVLVVAQMQLHYGYEGLEVGEPVIVTVTFAGVGEDGGTGGGAGDGTGTLAANGSGRSPATRPTPDVQLDVPDGLRLDSPRVWAAPLNEASWRIVAEEPGRYTMNVRVGGTDYPKTVRVSDAVVSRSPIRSDSLLDQILFPGEPGFPSGSPVTAIEVAYPEATVNFLGWHTHWLVPFLIITIVLAFALRKPLGVTF